MGSRYRYVLADPRRNKNVERERLRVLERENGRWVGLIVELRKKTEALLTDFLFFFYLFYFQSPL